MNITFNKNGLPFLKIVVIWFVVICLLSHNKCIAVILFNFDNSKITGSNLGFSDELIYETFQEMAQKESCTPNNHATCYFLQLASIEAFLNNKNDLFKTYIRTNIHLIQQISNEGKQPGELNRTLSKHYATFNLQQFLNLNLN